MPEDAPRDDSVTFPADLYVAALGQRCVGELRRARPQRPSDLGLVRDRYVINPGAIAYWLWYQFDLNIFNNADAARVGKIDPLSETVIISGRGAYALPHWCYLSTGIEPGDDRSATWPGIAIPRNEEAPK